MWCELKLFKDVNPFNTHFWCGHVKKIILNLNLLYSGITFKKSIFFEANFYFSLKISQMWYCSGSKIKYKKENRLICKQWSVSPIQNWECSLLLFYANSSVLSLSLSLSCHSHSIVTLLCIVSFWYSSRRGFIYIGQWTAIFPCEQSK